MSPKMPNLPPFPDYSQMITGTTDKGAAVRQIIRKEQVREAQQQYSELELLTFAEMVRSGEFTLQDIQAEYGEGAYWAVHEMLRPPKPAPPPNQYIGGSGKKKDKAPKRELSIWRKIILFLKAVKTVLFGEIAA